MMIVVKLILWMIRLVLRLVLRLVRTMLLVVIMALLTVVYANASGDLRERVADLMVLALDGKRSVQTARTTVQPTRDGGYSVVAR